MKNKIAICITTRNRPDEFRETWHNIFFNSPKESRIFIVDDASNENYSGCIGEYGARFITRQGIPICKNKCLELACNWGATDIFLFDDDTYPLTKDWYIPYINSQHPHLNYTFLHHNKVENDHKIHNLSNGCMMYIRREVIDKIGGFDTNFGLGKFEHVQFSYRAYSAGLVPHPFMDIVGSDKLIYCMDQDKSIERTMDKYEMAMLINNNREYYYKTRMLTDFIPFK